MNDMIFSNFDLNLNCCYNFVYFHFESQICRNDTILELKVVVFRIVIYLKFRSTTF